MMKKTNMHIDNDIHKELKRRALDSDKKLRDFTNDFLREKLNLKPLKDKES